MSDLAATILATSIAFSAFFVGYVFLLRESAKEMKDLSSEIVAAAESAQDDLDSMATRAARLANRRRGSDFGDFTVDILEPNPDLVGRSGDVLKGG